MARRLISEIIHTSRSRFLFYIVLISLNFILAHIVEWVRGVVLSVRTYVGLMISHYDALRGSPYDNHTVCGATHVTILKGGRQGIQMNLCDKYREMQERK